MPRTDPYADIYLDKKLRLLNNGTTTTTLITTTTTTATTGMTLTTDTREAYNKNNSGTPRPTDSRNNSNLSTRKTQYDSPPSSISPSVVTTVLKWYQLSTTWILVLTFVMVISIGSLVAMLDSFTHHQKDTIGCKESYMRPLYVKQDGFDSEMTRFAGKYGLYLYREKGVDLLEQATGIPVLFIPGHAGSYKQIRSIAAESAYYYHQHYAASQDTWVQGMRHLDFFTVDFNEEFSALHGQSLLEQAEYLNDAIDYILKLYPLSRKWGPQQDKQLPDPTSVIVIGHSMGGTVARTMFTIHNYQPGTINTIITLSTPHILPPAPFDWKISKIYDDIHHFWKSAYDDNGDNDVMHEPATITTTFGNATYLLKDVSMISIAGGNLDSTVCSDSANVGTFLPPKHGFTVFSTAIPRVWTGTDHVSILSCNQLVRVLSKTLLNIVDARRGSQTKPLEKRIKVLEKAFLSGLENRQGDGFDLDLGELTFQDLKFNESQFLLPGQRLVLDNNSNFDGQRKTMTFLPSYEGADGFAVLTSYSVGKDEPFDLLLCNKLEKHVKGTTRMGCRAATTNDGVVVPVPASTSQDTNPASGNTFMFASITFEEMHGYEFLAIVDRRGHGDSFARGFLMAEPYDFDTNTRTVEKSMLDIAFNGIQLQTSPALFSSIRIPSIESSMLAYHIIVDRGGRCSIPSHFTPLLRQSISSMHESKFYVNVANERKQIDMSVHGRTAFSTASPPIRPHQYRYRDQPSDDDSYNNHLEGLDISIWIDPSTCNQPVKIELTVDWYGSIGRIGFRNGIMLPAFTFIVVMAVWAMQIQCYFATGIYPHFGQAMVFCLRLVFPLISVLLAGAGIYQGWADADAYQLLDGHGLFAKWWKYYAPESFSYNKPSMTIVWNDVLTGRTDLFFWWIPLCGLFMSVGFVCVLWLFLTVFLQTCATLVSLYRHYYPFTMQSKTNPKHQMHNDSNSSSSSSSRPPNHGLFWFIPDGFGSGLDRQRMERRVITTLILFSLVATCIPYQFVFLVAFLVHIITCVRSLVKLWTTPPSKELERKNRYHYLQSILLLFITLLPFNAPILVVWVRNLSVHWFVPFSSDHSVFAIAPFMIYVEMLTDHTLMLPRISSRLGQWLTCCIFYSMVLHAFMFGIKYTHSLYFLSNQLIAWLVFLHFWHSSYGQHMYHLFIELPYIYSYPKKKS